MRCAWVWAVPFSLAATEGITSFSFPLGTEMFHFPRFASYTLMLQDDIGLLYRVSPLGDLRIKGCYTPPRSLSQLRYVLHRHFVSRHPPCTLNTTFLIPDFTVLVYINTPHRKLLFAYTCILNCQFAVNSSHSSQNTFGLKIRLAADNHIAQKCALAHPLSALFL